MRSAASLLVKAARKEQLMSPRGYVVALVAAVAVAIGCQSRSSMPLSPSSSDQGQSLSLAAPGGGPQLAAAAVHQHTVTLSDACDPDTFNDPITGVGPGTCLRPGGVRFQDFIAELMQHHSIGGWHMAPGEVTMKVGDVLSAVNRGGEEHTFTEVEEYGGGINSTLNALVGLTTVAPECNPVSIERLVPGQSTHETEEEEGVEKYQCCIHPWMRTVVHKVER
jgi:plastocyanin